MTSTGPRPLASLGRLMSLFPRFLPAARFTARSVLLTCLFWTTSYAWIYPEHRDITYVAIRKLDPGRRAVFDRLWVDARLGYESRLAAAAADSAQGEGTTTQRTPEGRTPIKGAVEPG